jgi:hypothetical protein
MMSAFTNRDPAPNVTIPVIWLQTAQRIEPNGLKRGSVDGVTGVSSAIEEGPLFV